MNWQAYDLLIFDLDGTLYEDTDHFDFYSQRLAERLPEECRPFYFRDEAASRQGTHVLRMGRVYDRRQDWVLATTPDGHVLQAWTWSGDEVSAADRLATYSEPVSFDMQWMLSIGDSWWIPAACAYHYGLESTYQAYLEAKDFLASDQASLTPIPGVKEGLEKLKSHCRLVVATNSDMTDTRRILQALGLEKAFSAIYSDCRKPARSRALFTQIAEELGVKADRTLSVGDNYLNDIYPAMQLGMAGCLIDPHRLQPEEVADFSARSLADCF